MLHGLDAVVGLEAIVTRAELFGGVDVFLFQDRRHSCDDIGMLVGDVVFFADVVVEVVEFYGRVGILDDVETDGLPVSIYDGDTASLFIEFPVEMLV
jgi:hypothetical protein